MKKTGFWTTDWFFALLIVIVIIGLSLTTGFFRALDTKAYDWAVGATSKTASDKVAVITIDEQSIGNLGRWPWSREIHAGMIDKLAEAKAKVIGHTVFFFEPQKDPGLDYINQLIEVYGKHTVAPAPTPAPEPAPAPAPKGKGIITPVVATPAAPNAALAEFEPILAKAEQALNTDRRLAESIKKAGNVILPMNLGASMFAPNGKPDIKLPDFVKANAVPGASSAIYAGDDLGFPIVQLGSVASAIGDLSLITDDDGGVRRDITTVDFFGTNFPSLALAIAAKSLNLGSKDIKVTPGESVSVGNLRIVTDELGLMFPYFYKDAGNKPAMPEDSFFDVYTGKIPAAKYKDKIVLIGATAAGVGTRTVTPIGLLSPVQTIAHSVSSILQQHFFRTPTWGLWVMLLALALVAAYLIALLPRLRAGPAAMFTLGIFVVLLGTHFALMMGPGIWVKLMLPAALLVIGHLLLTTKRFLMTERGKEQSEAAGAESNRMLGLADRKSVV